MQLIMFRGGPYNGDLCQNVEKVPPAVYSIWDNGKFLFSYLYTGRFNHESGDEIFLYVFAGREDSVSMNSINAKQ